MKLMAEVEYDAYDAFHPYGFADGDGVLKWEAMEQVYNLLMEMGYDYYTCSSIHNDGQVYMLTSPYGKKLEIDYNTREPREAIAETFPELAKALDELNKETLEV
jgi:beta-glucanase (GH16 family)